jgi:hypothetical protein
MPEPIELAAAFERSDVVSFCDVIDAPQTPLALRMCAASSEVAVLVAGVRVNANGSSGIQNPSRSKQF